MILKCFYGGQSTDQPETALETSWCGDCRDLAKTLEKHFKEMSHVIKLEPVGDRATWKAQNCRYRQAPYNLDEVPTLVLYDDSMHEIDRLACREFSGNAQKFSELITIANRPK